MNFTAEWQPEAEDQLAALWTAATDRAMVTWAARQVELLLGRDPLGQGEERGDDDRLMFLPPLAVLYRVDGTARVVRIVSVGWSGRPV